MRQVHIHIFSYWVIKRNSDFQNLILNTYHLIPFLLFFFLFWLEILWTTISNFNLVINIVIDTQSFGLNTAIQHDFRPKFFVTSAHTYTQNPYKSSIKLFGKWTKNVEIALKVTIKASYSLNLSYNIVDCWTFERVNRFVFITNQLICNQTVISSH